MYRARVAAAMSGGKGGGGLSPPRSQPESGPVSQLRTNCLSKLGCTTPSWYPSAGQYHRPVLVDAELELGVGEDDSLAERMLGGLGVDPQRAVPHGGGAFGAHQFDDVVEGDVLVVISQVRLARRSEQRLG